MMTTEKLLVMIMVAMFSMVLLVSCDEETEFEKQVKEDDRVVENYLSRNGISAEQHSSGLQYEILQSNSGGESVSNDKVVKFYYQLSTLDSAYEDVLADSANPVIAAQQFNRVLPTGLYHGLELMNKGEKYRMYIPAYLAYSNYSNAAFFDARSNFVIDIEVVDVLTQDEMLDIELDSIDNFIASNNITGIESFSSGLHFKSLMAGDGTKPSSNSVVEFHFKRMTLDSTLIAETTADNPVRIRLNQGQAVEGLEEGLFKMSEGEQAVMIMPSEIGFGASLAILPVDIRDELIDDGVIINASVPPYTPLIYEVELVDIE